jgi:hypothetical protein
MYGLLRNRRYAYLCDLQCGISDECLPMQGCDMFCGRIRCVSLRAEAGSSRRDLAVVCVVAEELLQLW